MAEIPRFNRDADRQEVLDKLEEAGVVILEQFVPSYELATLKKEYEGILEDGGRGVSDMDYSSGRGADVTLSWLDSNKYPFTTHLFSSPFMDAVADEYYDEDYLLNNHVYVVNDVVGQEHVAQDLHYDKAPTLKFFLYLEDTDEDNGAFTVVPGSHKFTREREAERREDAEIPDREITRDIPEDLRQDQTPVEGAGGSMIIFHTDVLHKAGKVSSGDRKVMRGHTRPKSYTGILDNIMYRERL